MNWVEFRAFAAESEIFIGAAFCGNRWTHNCASVARIKTPGDESSDNLSIRFIVDGLLVAIVVSDTKGKSDACVRALDVT